MDGGQRTGKRRPYVTDQGVVKMFEEKYVCISLLIFIIFSLIGLVGTPFTSPFSTRREREDFCELSGDGAYRRSARIY